jgi:hypothetical protein
VLDTAAATKLRQPSRKPPPSGTAAKAVPLFMWQALTTGGILFLLPVGVKAGLDWPLLGGSQVSKARPHGTPGQAGAPFAFPGLNRFGTAPAAFRIYGVFAGGVRNLSTLLLSTRDTPVSTNAGMGDDASEP